LRPPLLLVCLAHNTRTLRAVVEAHRFAVNILNEHQTELSDRFSRPGEDHFHNVPTVLADYGLPLIPGCLAYLFCHVTSRYPQGDHDIIVGRVEKVHVGEGSPLLFFRSRYRTLGPAEETADLWYW
jgi:flavin reductase (DIM6/NTAB) family NADH-FMN oxidoreductase RutF